MALSRDVVIRLLGDASSAVAAHEGRRGCRRGVGGRVPEGGAGADEQQAAEKAALEARKQAMQEASQRP
jgi:hypothetical protein